MFPGINQELAKKQFNNRNSAKNKYSIYPWNNYDFNYQEYIKNRYSPDKLGISSKPYLSTLTKDITNITKYPEILVNDPLLSRNTISGKSDINPKNIDLKNVKDKYDQFREPYPGFKKEYPELFPLTGEKANNYFIKIGTCPVKKIKTKKKCLEQGYQWHSDKYQANSRINEFYSKKDEPTPKGYCFKPRYLYIDNSNQDSTGIKGVLGNLGKNIMDLNPMGLLEILTKDKPQNKNLLPLKCVEHFQISDDLDLTNLLILLIVIIIGILMVA